MNAYTEQFAAQCGYIGNSPAMLAAFEDIRQAGIREARKAHYERVKLVDGFVAEPASFWGYINLFRITPLLSTDEAIEFWTNEAENQRVLRETGHWRYDAGKLRMAAERVVISRYFRRFGALPVAAQCGSGSMTLPPRYFLALNLFLACTVLFVGALERMPI